MKYIFISTTIFSWLIFALGAIAQELPKCSPKKSDFVGEDIKTYSVDWGFNRNPGRGGENYGADCWVPDPDANAVVEWEARERSCISCKGGRDVRIVEQLMGRISYPVGVHVGTRIDTGRNRFGGGGSYTGTITMSYVPYAKWQEVFFEKYARCS